MTSVILRILNRVRDEILPPRPTESVVRDILYEELTNLRDDLETLPYSDERVRALVWEVKYYASRKAQAIGGAILAQTLLDIRKELLDTPLLIPIPMHKKRRTERGHNHTELLATAALAHLADAYTYAPGALTRVLYTPTQQGLPKHMRRLNIKNSMKVPYPEMVAGKTCVLLDDVRTTGATLLEASKKLLEAGARDVVSVTLAHS